MLSGFILLHSVSKFLTRLHLNHLLSGDSDNLLGSGVDTLASSALLNGQCDDAGDLNLVTLLQSSNGSLDGSVQSLLCVNFTQASAFSNLCD